MRKAGNGRKWRIWRGKGGEKAEKQENEEKAEYGRVRAEVQKKAEKGWEKAGKVF